MLKQNSLILIREECYRILAVRDNSILAIDCQKRKMPQWQQLPADYRLIDDLELRKITGADFDDINSVSVVRRNIAYQRFTMIAGIVAVISNKHLYTKLIDEVSVKEKVTKQTVRKYLCDYLVFQDISVLVPMVRNRADGLTEDQKIFRWALNRYYYNQDKHSLEYTYNTLLKKKYCDSDGQLLDEYPSFSQFYRFYRNTRKLQNEMISRNGLGDYQRNERPLIGDGVQEYAPNLGVGMLDGTICDIYLVDDTGKLVGRPVLTACVDANTSMCMGYCLSWESGMYNIRNLMQNVITDKVEWCKRFGIDIKREDWNCHQLPGKFLTDKGSEYISENFAQLTELGITCIDLPAFRPDLKSYVEKSFDIIQGLFRQELKGKGVVEKDFGERTNRTDYRKQACLTKEEFEKVLLRCIIYYNRDRILENYPYSEQMLKDSISPHASDVWNYRVSEISSDLRIVDQQQLALTLLPRTSGRFARNGLKVNRLRYHCDGFVEDYLNGGECIVAYSPDDVSRVWLIRDGSYTEFKLIEKRFEGKDLQTVDEMKELQKTIINVAEDDNRQAKINLSMHIQDIANKEITDQPDVKGIRDRRKSEKAKKHIEIGSEIK